MQLERFDADDTAALLAYVDDHAHDDCQRSREDATHRSDTSDDAYASVELSDTAVDVPHTARKRQVNRGREKMKHEMAYLRRKVLHLEERLARLQRDRDEAIPPAAAAIAALGSPVSSASSVVDDSDGDHRTNSSGGERAELWRCIAQRQLRKRERSEAENARLREGLQSQIKLIQSLEKVLLKRSSSQLEDELLGRQRRHKRLCGFPVVNAAMLDDMLAKLDAQYVEMDTTFDRLGIGEIEKTTSSACVETKSVLFPQLPMGICVEILDVTVYPFGFQAVGAAIWEHRRQVTSDPRVCRYTAVEATPDTMAFSFEYSAMIDGREISESGVQAVRQFREENRVVLAWTQWSRPTMADGRPTAFEFVSQGWVCVRPLRNSPESSVLQYFTTLVPRCQHQAGDVKTDGAPIDMTDKNEVGAITEWVIAAFEKGVPHFREAIEDILLQRAGNSTELSDCHLSARI